MNISKTSLFGAVSAVALLAASVAYSANEAKTTTDVKASQTEDKVSPTDSQATVRADDLIGQELENTDGDNVGEIESVIIDADGEVAALIVGVGGFLGIGEREVAIDWNDITVMENGDKIHTMMTKEQLEGMPPYKFEAEENRRRSFTDNTFLAQRPVAKSDVALQKDAGGAEVKKEQMAAALDNKHLIGADVKNMSGDVIGEVTDILEKLGQQHLVVATSKFFGLTERDVLLSMDQVSEVKNKGADQKPFVEVNMTKEDLENLPEHES